MNKKTRRWLAATMFACLGCLLAGGSRLWPAHGVAQRSVVQPTAQRVAYQQVPMAFERNDGQTDARVRYVARGAGYSVFFTPEETVFSLRNPKAGLPTTLRMSLVGGNVEPTIEGDGLASGRSQYFLGSAPGNWRRDVPHYAKVHYRDVYPGVDVVYYGNQQHLEYDFVIAPHSNPDLIAIQFAGTQAPRLDDHGNLVLRTDAGDIVQHKPVVYQTWSGQRHPVEAGYRLLADNRVGFAIGAYDHRQPLVVDPVLAYSSDLGGSGLDYVTSVATDVAGNVYVTGNTESLDFPAATALAQGQAQNAGDIFVTKFNPFTDAVLYSAYIGGSAADNPQTVAVDTAGHAYIGGSTISHDFPVKNALQPFHGLDNGSSDAFVLEMAADGKSLLYSTYLGGSGEDVGQSLAIDASGAAYIGGNTQSDNYPTTAAALQTTRKGGYDAFVTKLAPYGTSLVYSTYLGGSYDDVPYTITTDPAGSVYVAGRTVSGDFPMVLAWQSTLSGPGDAFVSKLAPNGGSLAYSTYLGGIGDERAMGLATYVTPTTPATTYTWVVGRTNSINFPTLSAYQPLSGGGWDGFATQLTATGRVAGSTYLGGSGDDELRKVQVFSGLPAIVGYSNSTNYPVLNAVQPLPGGGVDAVYTQFNYDTSALRISTYLGGSGDDYGWAIALYGRGNTFIAGETYSTDFPLLHPFQQYRGLGDGFLSRIGSRGRLTTYTHDFNGDLAGDLLWRNPTSGANAIWRSGDHAHGQVVAAAPQNWKAVAVGNFNCDAQYQSDILWRDPVTGANRIWLSGNSGTLQSIASASPTWEVAGVGDFLDYSACRKDILWHNRSSGANVVWRAGRADNAMAITGVTDLDWHIVGVGDFNDDNQSDILWRHGRTGRNVIWSGGNSAAPLAVATVTDVAWTVVGIGDFLGDGPSDILWHNSRTGASVIWRSGNNATSQAVTTVTNLDWKILAVADYDGDGRSDIFWRNGRTGANAVWYEGNSRRQPSLPVVALSWSVVP